MRRKRNLLIFFSILFLLILAGCSSSKPIIKDSSKNSNGELIIKGHNFKGVHHGKGTAADPDYKYSMFFGKDGNFVQDIISSKGFAGRFTEKGTYTIDKSGDITMNIDSVTEERFNSDSDLQDGIAPISIAQRQGNTLNAAEDHPIKIENKKNYLLGTVNKVKLYSTDKKTVKYNKHYQSEKRKYDDVYNKFSDHGFTSNGMDTPMNAIAFKNSKFIWRYGYQDAKSTSKDSAVMAVFQGTYSYNSNNKIMTLKVVNQSNSYYGNLMKLGGFEYQKSGSPLAGNTIKLRYRNNTLALIGNAFDSWDMEDNSPSDASQSLPKYDDYISSYSVAAFDSQMHKGSSNDNSSGGSVKDVFPTKEDFAEWVTDYYQSQDDEDYENFHVLESGDGATLPITDDNGNKKAMPMVYRLYYSIAEEGNEISDTGKNIGISSDGKLYNGHDIVFDPDLTQAYQDYANN